MLTPLAPSDWSLAHAAHLLNRAGFGASPERVRDFHRLGLPAAVSSLFKADPSPVPAPEWTADPTSRKEIFMGMQGMMDSQERRELVKKAQQEDRRRTLELRRWWLERMRYTSHPLSEKMTLFWHGHFATSISKVKNPYLMWRQNETLRSYALGSFHEMLRAMTRDPAMIRWLDLGRSSQREPNENFAREILELFTLGEGHYTEDDIKQGARAFTGHRIDPETLTFAYARQQHDYGSKKFLGRSGDFNADDIVEIILAQDQCARFVGERIWEFFAYEDPEPTVLDSVATTFRRSKYEIRPLLAAIFQSREFYAPKAIRTQIKSPVDWLINACITLDTDLPGQPALDFILTRLGQLPFEPPNVRGWEGGKSWINSSTLVMRYNLAGFLMGARAPEIRRLANPRLAAPVDIDEVVPASLRNRPDALADALVFRFFGTPQLPRIREQILQTLSQSSTPLDNRDALALGQKLMSTPDFQLT